MLLLYARDSPSGKTSIKTLYVSLRPAHAIKHDVNTLKKKRSHIYMCVCVWKTCLWFRVYTSNRRECLGGKFVFWNKIKIKRFCLLFSIPFLKSAFVRLCTLNHPPSSFSYTKRSPFLQQTVERLPKWFYIYFVRSAYNQT